MSPLYFLRTVNANMRHSVIEKCRDKDGQIYNKFDNLKILRPYGGIIKLVCFIWFDPEQLCLIQLHGRSRVLKSSQIITPAYIYYCLHVVGK